MIIICQERSGLLMALGLKEQRNFDDVILTVNYAKDCALYIQIIRNDDGIKTMMIKMKKVMTTRIDREYIGSDYCDYGK